MKKVLPFVYPPIVNSYSGDSGRVAVQQNYPEHFPLIIVNHLTLTYDEQLGCCGFNWKNYNNDGFIDIDISNDLLTCGVTNHIIKCIDEGFNIQLYLDHFYIKGNECYNNFHRIHDNASVFGYDSCNETFLVADNFDFGKYYILDVGFQNLEEARSPVSDKPAIKYILTNNFKTDFFTLKNLCLIFDGYLSGIYLLPKKSSDDSTITYGIKVYDILLEYINKLEEKQARYDHRSFHVLCNHKSIILLLIEQLLRDYGIGKFNAIYSVFAEIRDQCIIARNLLVKYYVTENLDLLKRIRNLLISIKDKETEGVAMMLECLRNPLNRTL